MFNYSDSCVLRHTKEESKACFAFFLSNAGS